jgi:TAT (twin-arginine translocation) pathway signal sequence
MISNKHDGTEITDQKTEQSIGRRSFLQGSAAAGLLAALPLQNRAEAQAASCGPIEGSTREQLRATMMAGIADDVKKDLVMRAQASQELPTPAGLRDPGMLDNRFTVSYKTPVPMAMKVIMEYFAACSERDLSAAAEKLHFPYAVYEGTEPLIYQSASDFIKNAPQSIRESTKMDSQLRPGSYDMIDNIQLHTFNPVNVGLELSYTRYRKDGYKIGSYETIHAITNNAGTWGIQLSSVIFTPTEFIGQRFNDAVEAHLRQGRTAMAAFADRDYELLTHLGWGTGSRVGPKKTASIMAPPGAETFFLSGWAGKPMEPYNSNDRKSRLVVKGFPNEAAINALSEVKTPLADYEHGLHATNIVMPNGNPGWFFAMAGGGVGLYGYTMDLSSSKVLHASAEKAHALGGYIRYTPDSVFISETRSLGIMILDKQTGTWGGGGAGFGQSMYRDRSNDDLG